MYKKNNLTAKQETKIVLHAEIHKRFCELEHEAETWTNLKQNLHYVLFALLLDIKPKRADLGDVYITQNGKVPRTYAEEKNYIILDNSNSMLVMNKYKTSKRYGTLREPLTEKMVEVIHRSLEAFPRKYLFVHTNDEKRVPFTINNSYSQFVKRAFETNFERSQGVSLWRRVYVSENVEFTDVPYDEVEKAANLSSQSVETQLLMYKGHKNSTIKRRTEEEKKAKLVCNNNAST